MSAPRHVGGRYTGVAILLHWLIALGVLALLALGLTMVNAKLPTFTKFRLFQWHKSIGITVLLLALLRLAWRLRHRPPPLPAGMAPLERRGAEAVHFLLYALLLGMPIVGWMVVSSSPLNIPTRLYGVIPWPHLPILPHLANRKAVEAVLARIHQAGAWLLIALVCAHVGAALLHHFVRRDDVLLRMLPRLRARPAPEPLEERP